MRAVTTEGVSVGAADRSGAESSDRASAAGGLHHSKRVLRLGSPIVWRVFLGTLTVASIASHLLRSSTSYDLFIDEPFYAQVGQSIARGHLPYAAGAPFFLHPPGYFLVEALWMRMFGLHGEVFAQVYSLRKLIAIFAGLAVLFVALIVDRVCGRTAAVCAALLYAINAFVQRDSGINILEPSTVCWALAGWAALLYLAPPGTRKRKLQIVGAGLLFGYAVLSKEFALFITIVPLLVVFVLRAHLSRREALAAAGIAAVPYLAWVGVVAASGNFHAFTSQMSTGFRRTAGTTQITGFNKAGAPSFVDTLISNVSYLWTAYAILGLGSLAILYLAWRPAKPQQRFIACLGLGALPLIMYCVLIGTNEEQFFNFLLAPALIALVTVVWSRWRRWRAVVRWFGCVLLVGAVASDLVSYATTRAATDNGTYQVDRWMAEHVAPGTVIAVTNSVQREILTRYTMVNDNGGAVIANPDVRYQIVFYRQVDERYAFVDRPTVDRQVRGLPVLFSTSDRSNGRMVVYGVN